MNGKPATPEELLAMVSDAVDKALEWRFEQLHGWLEDAFSIAEERITDIAEDISRIEQRITDLEATLRKSARLD